MLSKGEKEKKKAMAACNATVDMVWEHVGATSILTYALTTPAQGHRGIPNILIHSLLSQERGYGEKEYAPSSIL